MPEAKIVKSRNHLYYTHKARKAVCPVPLEQKMEYTGASHRMPLTIGVTPFAPWASLIPLLEHLGLNTAEFDPNSSYMDAQGPWLLLHTRPEYAVALALDEGKAPRQALDAWQSEAQALLNFYKSHHEQAAMAEIYGAARHPDELVNWLTHNHDGFPEQLANPKSGSVELDVPIEPSELSLLFATELVVQTPSLEPLLAQLEASSIPLGREHYARPTVDVEGVIDQLNKRISDPPARHERLREQLEEHEKRLNKAQTERDHAEKILKSENELLLTQLHKVQEELETYYHKAQSANKGNGELSEVQAENEVLLARESDLKEENDLILKQLCQVQEELERYYLDGKANAEILEKSKAELKTIQKALARAEKSEKDARSKLKETENKLKDAEKKLKTSEHQTATLQAKLAEENANSTRLQTELNSAQTLAVHTSRRLEETQRAKEQLQKEKDDLGVENYQLSCELALANIELRNARKKLHFVEHSTSWRLTTPLRRAAKLVSKSSRGRELLENHIQLIKQSDLFDPKWYLNNNSDLREKGVDPAEHYVMYGGKEGRAPSPNFDAKEYLKKYPDVAESGQNPLVHYLLHGKAEGRKI